MGDIATVPEFSPAVVKHYYRESWRCLEEGLCVAAILLSFACLEVALLDALSFEPWKPISRRYPKRMGSIDLLDWGRQVGCLSEDGWRKGHRIRDYRNALTHPGLDYKRIAKRHTKMARLVREAKRDWGTFDRSHKLKASAAFHLMSRQVAREAVSDVHDVLEHVYTRGPFSGGGIMSLRTGKTVGLLGGALGSSEHNARATTTR